MYASAAATLHVLSFSIDFTVYTREGMVLEVSITNGFNGRMLVFFNEETSPKTLRNINWKLLKRRTNQMEVR
jgi:hypothetical protein